MMQEAINAIYPRRNKRIIEIFIILIIIFLGLIEVRYSIYKIKLLQEEYKTIPIDIFIKGHFYKHCFDILKLFTALVIDLNLLVFFLLIQNFDLFIYFIRKFLITVIYANYLYFGPFIFFGIVLFLKHGNEIFFYYDEEFNDFVELDVINIIFSFIFITFSFTFIFLLPILFAYYKFISSLKIERYGNYLVGKIFWYLALKHSTTLNLRL